MVLRPCLYTTRIVAASLPYVAGKFGGSILAAGSFHPLRMRQQMLRMGRNSRLYFPGDGRAQSSLSWPSFHHSNTYSESGTGVKGNVKT